MTIEQDLDAIDAAFFSADTFHNARDLEKVEKYVMRWVREIERIKKQIEEGEN